MDNQIENPFTVVKANDYTNAQINDNWVDIALEPKSGFINIIKPTTATPMIIKGGKGSGKTHLMRYFSYPIQKMRCPDSKCLIDYISEERFIGIYNRCGGLDADRFSNKGFEESKWKVLFQYYYELWIAQYFINTLTDLLASSNITDFNERLFCEKAFDLFTRSDDVEILEINHLLNFLKTKQHELDHLVNNCIYTNELQPTILCNPGALIFGLPKIAQELLPSLSNTLFVYMFDEVEHLNSYQQQHLQSLLRERKEPCTIKLGVRTYGLLDLKTFAADEINREGDELEIIRLDEELRNQNNKAYTNFALRLCLTRLIDSGLIPKSFQPENLYNYFDIDVPPSKDSRVTSGINGSSISKLKTELHKYTDFKKITIKSICQNLAIDNDPITEKAAIFCFYQAWGSGKSSNFLSISEQIKQAISEYLANPSNSGNQIYNALDKHKSSFEAQLREQHNIKEYYSGLNEIIDLSRGFPRNFLTILKFIYQRALVNNEEPFVRPISSQSQFEGIKQSSDWFFDDARVTGSMGENIQTIIRRIAELFKAERFSDKPIEAAPIKFDLDISNLDNSSHTLLKTAALWSFFIKEKNERLDKNSQRKNNTYILNPLLSPYWKLPIAKRGTLPLNKNALDAIFDLDSSIPYKDYFSNFKNKRNVPFNLKNITSSQGDLFDDGNL
ncbi:hypothetical protein [Kangiella sp.]|uniref:ORC-CDC6 family AAA ATPase n=1 Tax=Kangiella sp. TaxID=1920245 RepID=UPI003A8D0242